MLRFRNADLILVLLILLTEQVQSVLMVLLLATRRDHHGFHVVWIADEGHLLGVDWLFLAYFA